MNFAPTRGLAEALHVTDPSPEHRETLMLFGQFVGSWKLEWAGVDADGRPAQATGELHFGWVLGGRAVQDIWIVPGRGQAGEGQPPLAFHGSTLRFYDPAIDAWRSTWIEPINARVRRFIGRPDGNDIMLLSAEDDPQLRWHFTDITTDSSAGSPRAPATRAPHGASTKRCAPPAHEARLPAFSRSSTTAARHQAACLAP
jgi:hypothetical protein